MESETKPQVIHTMESSKGKMVLVVDGFKYSKGRTDSRGQVVWRCVRRDCRGLFMADDDYNIFEDSATTCWKHTHPPHSKEEIAQQILQQVIGKNKKDAPWEKPKSLVQRSFDCIPDAFKSLISTETLEEMEGILNRAKTPLLRYPNPFMKTKPKTSQPVKDNTPHVMFITPKIIERKDIDNMSDNVEGSDNTSIDSKEDKNGVNENKEEESGNDEDSSKTCENPEKDDVKENNINDADENSPAEKESITETDSNSASPADDEAPTKKQKLM